MSLEDRMRRARRAIKRRDADLAKKGTSAAAEQAKRNKAIQRTEAAQSRSRAFTEAASSPSIKSMGVDSLKTGDAPLEVKNDSGFGTHVEHPNYKCGECRAAFHENDRLEMHNMMHHGAPDKLFGY